MIKTSLTELLDIEHPILQGGMAWIATWQLVAAVSEAGGLGILGAGNAPATYVREQIALVRMQTQRPFGVNVPLFSPSSAEVIQVCIEERVPVVTTGAGNPTPFMPGLKEAGIKVIPVVASAALARRLERAGADALIAEGLESGGHIGSVTTLALVPAVVDAVRIPVVAAGGLADGRGLVAALAMGAAGIQMGTRFICSQECIAHDNYKQAIIKASERSTMVTGQSVGHPVRCMRNSMSRQFEELEERGISEEELIEFGAGRLRLAAIDGDVMNGSVMAGQASVLVNEILPTRMIVEQVVTDAQALLDRLAVHGGGLS